MSIGIFIKTCKKDLQWIEFCFKSIDKNLKGFKQLTVVTEPNNRGIIDYTKIITTIPINIHFVDMPEISHPCSDGIGYLWMQNIKLLWHNFCNDDAVLQIDSDCIIYNKLTPQHYIVNNKFKWWIRDWKDAEGAIVHKNPLSKLLGQESKYEHMLFNGWMMDRSTTIDFHNWLKIKHNCDWWTYLLEKTKEDWLSGIRGSSIYNAYGGFLESHNKQYIFIKGFIDIPPIKQYWSWGGDKNKQDININNLKIDNFQITDSLKEEMLDLIYGQK